MSSPDKIFTSAGRFRLPISHCLVMNANVLKAIGQIPIVCFALLALALPNQGRAQFTGDNQTNIISGVTSNWTGAYYVGSNYVFDALLIQNGGVLSNSGPGVIGYTATAKSNAVVVSGSGSVWNIGGFGNGLAVGRYGAGNSLLISNGGAVVVAASGLPGSFSSVGGYGDLSSFSASNNAALVTGSGSLWSNRNSLFIGNQASGNRLVISAGASVVSSNGFVGYYGSNNSVLVTGPGSVWSNSTNLYMGYGSSASWGNSLVISNGARVVNSSGLIGYAGASSNSVLVTGPGSTWTNQSLLNVQGQGSKLTISNGAAVFDYAGAISLRCSVVVSDSGSVWSNSTTLAVNSSGNALTIANGGTVVGNGAGIGGFGSSGNSNVVTVTGSGSLWDTSHQLYYPNTTLALGSDGGSVNTLVITNGGKLMSDNAILGQPTDPLMGGTLSSNNTVLVTGSGSVWSNRYDLSVGYYNDHSGTHFSSGNRLVISNGGAVFGRSASFYGYNESILVTGSGSLCQTYSFGLDAGSSVVISNGGCVIAAYASDEVYGGGAITVSGGSLYVTNSGETGVFNTGTGAQIKLDSGTITADTNLFYGSFVFNGGVLNSRGTKVANTQLFVVGDGTNSATFHLLGGVHSFTDGLRIRTNSFLTGCGTINGDVTVDLGGTVVADGCGTLTFTGNVTNNGVMMVENGSVLESSGTLVNNGQIYFLGGGTTNFSGTFINNGTVLNADVRLAIEPDGDGGYFIRFTGIEGFTYRLQRAPSLAGPWTTSSPQTAPASGLVKFWDLFPPPDQAFYRAVQP